jgi:hypothetical protein
MHLPDSAQMQRRYTFNLSLTDREITMNDISDTPNWRITGDWFDNCSCAVACPCTFGQAPDNNFCEHVLFWHIREGHFGDVELNDLCISLIGSFDGNLWDYDARGRAGMIIDDRASDDQVDAISKIFGGEVGGWWAEMGKCFTRGMEFLGAERATFSFEIAPGQSRWGVDIPGKVKAWAEALSGPTSTPGEPPRMTSAPGAEVGPGQIFTWGKSTVCEVDAFGFNYSWTVSSAKHAPFDWSGQ